MRKSKRETDKKVFKIISETAKQIRIPDLRKAAIKSLNTFYNKQYSILMNGLAWQLPVLTALFLLQGKALDGAVIKPTAAQKDLAFETIKGAGYDGSRQLGVPLKRFSDDYINKHVKPTLDRLISEEARDPGDMTERNTLRNRAEMEVRYHDHLDQISDYKKHGVRLVIASTHADCSDRCAKWQGLVYSLDGSSGNTSDGRSYQPLENATDVYYTTKAGKTYKNGLLGFNCRHFLVPYEHGYRFPNPNVKEERKEYAITLKQRELERNVRKWRTVAVVKKNVDRKTYLKAKQKAEEWNAEYIRFSKKNNRAYDPSRTKLI